MPWISTCIKVHLIHKSVNVISLIKRMKDKSHHLERYIKALDKIQHPLSIKIFSKLVIEQIEKYKNMK